MAVPAALQAYAARAELALPVGVAYSGGADSSALLHACHARWPGRVVALHIHHGLQSSADDFAHHCQMVCAALQVPLQTQRIDARHGRGESPEDAARKARYMALVDGCAGTGVQDVLLAQHADDQVETLLLALSRGAGLPGLAAMPERFERHGMHFHRPLLGLSSVDIRTWLQAQGAPHVVDPSNENARFTRNKIRLTLMPALAVAFPQYRETFLRSARHAAQAQTLLESLALIDQAQTGVPPLIHALRQLPGNRQANLLRNWLQVHHGVSPSAAQLDALMRQVAACTTRGHQIHLKVASGFVVRETDRLAYNAPL